jgi:hypothetical protein
MRKAMVLAIVAMLLWGTTTLAGEKIKLPSGPAKAAPQVTTAIQHGSAPITKVDWAGRAWRNGWYGGYGGYYRPYYSFYRPYYSGYAPYYGGYYSAPYYGYSYYAPGGYYRGWGPGASVGVGPLAYGRIGGWYW